MPMPTIPQKLLFHGRPLKKLTKRHLQRGRSGPGDLEFSLPG